MEKMDATQLCEKHMHRYVLVTMEDNSRIDGILAEMEEEYLVLAEPAFGGGMTREEAFRPYGYPGYGGYGWGYPGYGWGYPGYGYGGGYGYPGYGWGGYGNPYRRFRRRVLPLAGLAGLALLPYF